jgi:hypothetical protein
MNYCRGGVIFVAIVAFVSIATAQNPYSLKSRPSSSPATKPLTPKSPRTTQPLTPKSATPKRRASVPLPNAANSRKTNIELAGLEQQSLKAEGSKGGNAGTAKSASIKPIGTPSRSGSGINASYQKPRISQNK